MHQSVPVRTDDYSTPERSPIYIIRLLLFIRIDSHSAIIFALGEPS